MTANDRSEEFPDWQTFRPDADGDGLPDTWETDGIDTNDDGTPEVDLPAMGAAPTTRTSSSRSTHERPWPFPAAIDL